MNIQEAFMKYYEEAFLEEKQHKKAFKTACKVFIEKHKLNPPYNGSASFRQILNRRPKRNR